MQVFERYLFKNLFIGTLFIAVTLAAVILLTQSLRFLELVIDSGASGISFWFLTMLALPRFFEIILPISLMASTVFIYNKMTIDSEIVVMRSVGASPLLLARPAIILSIYTTILLLVMTTWLAPLSLASMHHMRQVIKAQYSSLLFREGVFNEVGSGLTIYVRDRDVNGEMRGVMIHDSRDNKKHPVTILAKRGMLVSTDGGQQVLVYDGSRQSYNNNKKILSRLEFDRYSIDLPDGSGAVRQRWREPDERTILELLNPDPNNKRDVKSQRDFNVEIHRRIVSPLLAPAFVFMALAMLLIGPVERRGQGKKIAMIIVGSVLIQGFYLGAFSFARNSDLGLVLMYILTLTPIAGGAFILSSYGENIRHKILYSRGNDNSDNGEGEYT